MMLCSKWIKALALLLAALLVTVGMAGVALTVQFYNHGLYNKTYEKWSEEHLYNIGYDLAQYYCNMHRFEQMELYDALAGQNVFYYPYGIDEDDFKLEFQDGEEKLAFGSDMPTDAFVNTYTIVSVQPTVSDTNMGLGEGIYVTLTEGNAEKWVWLSFDSGPEYEVRVAVRRDALLQRSESYALICLLHPYQNVFPWLILCFLPVIPCAIILYRAAGRRKDGSLRPGGLNRLPADVHLLLSGLGISWLWQTLGYDWGDAIVSFTVSLVQIFAIALLALNVLLMLSAQFKMGWRYVWGRSVIGFAAGKLWKALCFCARGIRGLFRVLPLAWQWLLTAVAMVIVPLFFLALAWNAKSLFILFFLFSIALDIAVVLYGAYCYGTLAKGAREMSRGNLEHRIPNKHLVGCFDDFARELNALGGAARNAAMEQMKSERMKTELITNVSHDIKTPLTSIINFVDLLQKPHTQQEQQEYLEVLSRQTGQMKRLLEDLLELSKASSGAIAVNITQLDLTETVRQALGEFSDRLAAARLTPVLRCPEQSVMAAADGRLVWRVLSNLLSNAVKYAMPDTRLYLQLEQEENAVRLSIKNISREELKVSAEELMERFVRGDAARSAEGSGLGLNIARSLMQVQRGELTLTLDGDLFKVTLLLPKLPE